ncbi:hypothetical protein AAHC03_020702 [Spirometra sp. Aus1]
MGWGGGVDLHITNTPRRTDLTVRPTVLTDTHASPDSQSAPSLPPVRRSRRARLHISDHADRRLLRRRRSQRRPSPGPGSRKLAQMSESAAGRVV